MKFKRTVLLAMFVVALGLLLGANAAPAATVICENDPAPCAEGESVIRIENLPVVNESTAETEFYNVDFLYDTGTSVYGSDLVTDFPPPDGDETILLALEAVTEALNLVDPTPSAAGPKGTNQFFIGYKEEAGLLVALGGENIAGVWNQCDATESLDGVKCLLGVAILSPGDTFTYADFTLVSVPPDPVTIGGTVSGLEGSGLVLQNNESDDEPIDSDGEFTFDTPLTPGTSYNVSVKTQPSDPGQTCSVANGSGLAPPEDVTDVAVTCAEPVLGDLIKVAAEGDTLDDNTVLKDILLDGGVAINLDGQVAFGGRDGDGIDAVFTQAGKVVAEGDTLVGGTTLAAFRGQGEVAISAGLLSDTVAFHGTAETGAVHTPAVFTQFRKVAAVGDEISLNSTLDDIDPEGKVAINYMNEVAFHGRVKIQSDLLSGDFRAVFISDGLDTLVVAQEDTELPDETYLDNITESGGVAISDMGEVAFHGQTDDPAPGSDTLKAVFTQNGLIAKVGDNLPDETTLENINENGGVAINLLGWVAFHGQTGAVKAVFISDGETIQVVAKEGDDLDDRTPLDEIEVNGGVAINVFGDVVFHGRTGAVKAVFTQKGLVAKVGDNVNGGTTLSQINDIAGVAINPYGIDVAFHGKVGITDAVFVGSAPDTGPNTPPVADFSFSTDDLTVDFTDESTDPDGDVVEWLWEFGDGAISRLPNPSRTYTAADTYNVTLTVTDDRGAQSDPVIKQVEVTEPPFEGALVFVTSVGYPGNFGGLAEADAICQELAENAGLTGTWTAWLSDDNTDARDRIPDEGPYKLLDLNQTIVADDLADLTDSSLDAPIILDENGELPFTDVWTGTQPDGTRTVSNCSNWTNAEDGYPCTEGDPDCGTKGGSDDTSGEWTEFVEDEFLGFCSATHSFYCFGTGQ